MFVVMTNVVLEYSSPLGCDAVLLGEWFVMFWRIIVPPPLQGSSSPRILKPQQHPVKTYDLTSLVLYVSRFSLVIMLWYVCTKNAYLPVAHYNDNYLLINWARSVCLCVCQLTQSTCCVFLDLLWSLYSWRFPLPYCSNKDSSGPGLIVEKLPETKVSM